MPDNKPSQTVEWATDATLLSGTQIGDTTRLEPSSGQKGQGNIPGMSAPGRWYNWLFGRLGDWTKYLDNLHNETQFLNKSYTWTNNHTWTASTTFQADIGQTGNFVTSGNVSAVSHEYNPAQTASIAVPLTYLTALSGTPTYSVFGYVTDSGTTNVFEVPLKHFLRVGMTVTKIRVGYSSAGGTGHAVDFITRGHGAGGTVDPTNNARLTVTTVASGTLTAGIFDTGTISHTVSTGKDSVVRITTGNSAGDEIRWLVVDVSIANVQVR